MAKKIIVPRRTAPGASVAVVQTDAAGKFDKFSAFALALPCTVLALVCLFMAVSYTSKHFGVGLFGIGAPSVQGWDAGSDSLASSTPVSVTGLESHDYIGRVSEGEVDVAVINAGSDQRVNLGDVFVLESAAAADVRIEFVVFEVQTNYSRGYILLGQNVEGDKKRQYGLKRDQVVALCGGVEDNIRVKRLWRDQIVRRYTEGRK